LIVMGLAMFFSFLGVKRNKQMSTDRFNLNVGYILSFLLLFFFLAFRVNLGRDWDNYMYLYTENYQQDYSFSESLEFGFLFIIKLLKQFSADFQWLIIISSFLTLLFFYGAFRRCYYLLPLGIFVFFTQWGYPVVINTIRQGIAILSFMCAVSYIGESGPRAFLKYLGFILIGSLFHYTILLFLPVILIGKMRPGLLQLLLVPIIAYGLSFFLIIPLFNDALTLFSKYSYSVDSYSSDRTTFGLGALLVLIIRLLPLTIYNYVKDNYPVYVKYYILYYLGIGVYYAFFKFLMIVRVTFYLQFLELILFSLLIYISFSKIKYYRLYGLISIFLTFVYYFYTFGDFLEDQLVSNDFSLLFMDYYFKK